MGDRTSLSDKANSVRNAGYEVKTEAEDPDDLQGREAEAIKVREAERGAQNKTGEKRSSLSRIMAIIGLLILVALVVWLVFCLATGSKYTMAVLFCVILYPVLLYIAFWLKKVFS